MKRTITSDFFKMCMNDSDQNKNDIEQAVEDLFTYAIDREDTRWLLARFPAEADVNPSKIEFELQILKIVSVGWSLSVYLEDHPRKTELLEPYWQQVHTFSQDLSESTKMMTGEDIDYFQILRERLDTYVAALAQHPKAPEPARVIGPEFAEICGDAGNLFAFMTGSKMFKSAVENVGAYLRKVGLSAP